VIDFGTIATLAIVVWLDGWRRLTTDALLVTRVGVGAWTVRPPFARIGNFGLVASWAPLIVPVVLLPSPGSAKRGHGRGTGDFDRCVARSGRRLRRVRAVTALLRALGIALTLWIIVGIPVVTAHFGGPGLIQGVMAAFLLSVAMTFGTALSLRSLRVPFRRAFRTAAPLLSPFTAPRAAEIVTATAVGPLDSLAPLVALLGRERFLAWLRPWAYDELAGRRPPDGARDATVEDLLRDLPRSVLEQAAASCRVEVTADADRYCPRCTRTYRDVAATCRECDDIPLLAVPRSVESASV
jgi:hypothetical protein